MAFTADAVLAQARSEIGYTESPAGSNRTKFAGEAGHANGQPWCATFAVAMARRCGGAVGNESAYTPSLYGSMRHVSDPLPGDLAFFDFPDRVDRIQHVGIVVGGDATSVTCVEGNTSSGSSGSQSNGGGVYLRTRSRRVVVGFGRPDYAMSAEEDDMFGDQDRATLDAAYKSADAASQRQQWAFRWYGQLHAVHVTDGGDLVHSTWNGQKWVVEVVGRGCDGGYEPVVMTEPSRVRVWCRSADRRGLVHVVYEQQSGVWSQTRVG